jgi:putative membrane-bound dehydrogenase-like protein
MRRGLAGVLMVVCAANAFAEDLPISPEQAVARMKVPEGFRVSLVAGEPQLIKPIAMTTDDRGRLWVVETHSYPRWLTRDDQEGRDRILILEERPDGRYDTKVFWDRGRNLSGIALGFGGVWLCATPNLIFVPIKPGTDTPAGPPQIVLDGWSLDAKHNVFNALVWGPDGWLYGCNGILSNSRIGAPGTPPERRVAMNCGVWRYHPTRKRFEVVASGTTNPWGLDFDEFGEIFITNCVIKHLFHIVPGGHYERMFGQDLTPHCYGLMASCADHIHWGGGAWTSSRGGGGSHDAPGGGHAHAGALIYLGDNWPAEYRGHVFMCNIHGNRINQDTLERKGSGYVAHHAPDFLLANDSWFRGLGLQAAADGGVFVSDWHDTGECHTYDKAHPSGRIYKVTFGQPKRTTADLATADDDELVRLQSQPDEWHARHARRLLQERAAAGNKFAPAVKTALLRQLRKGPNAAMRLRALWTLDAVEQGLGEELLQELSRDREESLRVWAVRQMAGADHSSATMITRLIQMTGDESPAVRLALASALPRLSTETRWSIVEGLVGHKEDAGDANLPLMIWYGLEPIAAADPDKAAGLIHKCRIPLVRQNLAHRIASLAE